MNLLLIGGAGRVARMIQPHLSREHRIRIFDRVPPGPHDNDYHQGDITDPAALAAAMDDIDAVVFLAMGPLADWESLSTAATHFDVSVKGLYLALRVAAESGIRRVVHTSSMSVYSTEDGERFPTEDVLPDAYRFYGLAKRCGEEVCRAAATAWDMNITALRLCLPTEQYRWSQAKDLNPIATSADDTARAYLAALHHPASGFRVYAISGDTTGRYVNTGKALRELGWSPQDIPAKGETT